jgi:acyl-CoA reductase-like NAD-dependent aldehyde dehydrogenase
MFHNAILELTAYAYSEVAPHTAALLADLFPKYLDNHCFRIVNGDKETSISLLENPLGHVLFTGGTIIGKEVMKLAAKNLTPVTLELGGRNAAVVTELANIKLAAKRILWAKFAIAGQTCFAPNHVLVHDSLYEEFVAAMCEV